ncbi:hypothetical protein ABZ915_02510 [Streptomyces sp. NPDC046915]|uniref:hypothetical protein n=1 Tax=Streptomyces sp. NPDC046915 TaxID=3155257 RepID=UPI0033D18FB4
MTAPAVGSTGEITVHRCTVTVVRRGGWSWGPDPRALVRRAVDAVPQALEEHFAEHLAGDGPDVEITEPVIVVVRPGGSGGSGGPGRSSRSGRDQMSFDVHVVPASVVEVPADAPDAEPESFEEFFATERTPWSAPGTGALFTELAERNELDALLGLLPDDSLRVFLRALLDAGDPSAGQLSAELARRAALRTGPDGALPEPLRGSPPDADLPRPRTRYTASAAHENAVPPPAAGGSAVPRTTGREAQVCSALPFLLAGPLARIGYLDAIGPALAGVELADDAPMFAAALAYKVLGPTARGWRRDRQDGEAAAVFAGLEPPLPEERLTAFADRVRPALPLLDGVLALAVCRGHDPADPLLLTGADSGLLLVDAQGMFPVAWAGDTARLLPHWQACGRPPVLICDGPLPPGTLSELAAADVPFMTAVRPLRGDPATRLPWRTPLWTAAEGRPDPRLAAALPGHAARLADLVTALTEERRAVPLATHGDLERTVTLAAALGLSTIAWTLWRERETPDPLLALSRFADLEAIVRFETDAVRVRVPLGRRHADLLRGGLLADVPDVVWLRGRTLTFSGG